MAAEELHLAARPAALGPGLAGAVACGAAALACVVATARLALLAPALVPVLYLALMDLVGLVALVVALLVGVRRPGSPVAALLGLQGLVPCLVGVSDAWTALVTAPSPVLAATPWGAALAEASWMAWYVPPALLLLLFPTARLPGPRWRLVAAGVVGVPLAHLGALLLVPAATTHFPGVPAPLPAGAGVSAVAAAVWTAAPFALLGLLVASLVAAVRRYRRSTGVERAQLTWFLLGATFVPLTLLVCWLSYLVLDGPDLAVLGLVAVGLAIPAATGVAVLRHDLYDVDRALAATTTCALLSTVLLGVYTLAAFLGGLWLGRESPVLAAATTAVCAAALAPVRARLRRVVDRRVDPARQRVLGAVASLEARAHAGLVRPERLQAVLSEAFGAPVRVGYRLPGAASDDHVDADGAALPPVAAGEQVVPVEVAGEEVGVLVAPPGAPRTLLREAATAAALVVEVVRLRVGLTAALRDVAESRGRLLEASLEERRRLEQDLHDGAQQRLVSLGVALRLAQRRLASGALDVLGPGAAPGGPLDGVLDGAVQQLSTAVAELRQIAHGLRPASLGDGLGAALGSMLERVPVPVDLRMDLEDDDGSDAGRRAVPEAVATTAYYVASEAVANAVKHSGAERIALSAARHDDALVVSVRDDGCGGASLAAGSGLAGLADRVAAAGGDLRLVSPRGAGTLLEVRLPCGS
ncbi:two-component sensor histidine kinase [Streptomyces sp. NP160]|uniref:histidine kinase n=1 Tax=Streptomyces sp. NP160 TaxID=2586637 RepID=UPI001117FBFE|nr:histidine kinase [Streptomyces sp. NP160]TNM69090.1 two-component sensor histidine kinase [Streptomyces sp. NP160]